MQMSNAYLGPVLHYSFVIPSIQFVDFPSFLAPPTATAWEIQSFPLPAMNQPIRQCQPSSQRTSPSTKFLPPSPSVAANWSSLQPPFSSSSSASSKFHPKPPNLPVAQSPGNHRPSPGIFDTQLSMRRDHLGGQSGSS